VGDRFGVALQLVGVQVLHQQRVRVDLKAEDSVAANSVALNRRIMRGPGLLLVQALSTGSVDGGAGIVSPPEPVLPSPPEPVVPPELLPLPLPLPLDPPEPDAVPPEPVDEPEPLLLPLPPLEPFPEPEPPLLDLPPEPGEPVPPSGAPPGSLTQPLTKVSANARQEPAKNVRCHVPRISGTKRLEGGSCCMGACLFR